MSQISTHVLNTSEGKPAQGLDIFFYHKKNNKWEKISEGITDKDGRINDLLEANITAEAGIYKMEFDTGKYFRDRNEKCFYPVAEIIFEITGTEHYHIPLLLSPFGYTTYRGS